MEKANATKRKQTHSNLKKEIEGGKRIFSFIFLDKNIDSSSFIKQT